MSCVEKDLNECEIVHLNFNKMWRYYAVLHNKTVNAPLFICVHVG